MPLSTARLRLLILAAGLAVATVIMVIGIIVTGGDETATPTQPPTGSDVGMDHIHALVVDPGDGQVYAASHHGLWLIPAGQRASRVGEHRQDLGALAVVGPKKYIAGGHGAAGGQEPPNLGLIETTDGGLTWRELSLANQADFHALVRAHGLIYGADSASRRFLVSGDDGRTWEPRESSADVLAFAVSPSSPEVIVGVTDAGTVRSDDGGRTFTPLPAAPTLTVLTWPAPDALFGVDPMGRVQFSADGGATWQPRGTLQGPPQAITATDADHVYAATAADVFTSTDGGRTFTFRAN